MCGWEVVWMAGAIDAPGGAGGSSLSPSPHPLPRTRGDDGWSPSASGTPAAGVHAAPRAPAERNRTEQSGTGQKQPSRTKETLQNRT